MNKEHEMKSLLEMLAIVRDMNQKVQNRICKKEQWRRK